MRETLRQSVQQQFAGRCGYCGIHESEVGARLTIDHYQPVSGGGTDDPNNLVYCCHACNEYKSDYWSDDRARQLLRPGEDDIETHLIDGSDFHLVGLTERGRLHIAILRLNRPELIAARQRRSREVERVERLAALELRLEQLETQIQSLTVQIASLTGGITIHEDTP